MSTVRLVQICRAFMVTMSLATANGCIDPWALGGSESDSIRLRDNPNLAHLAEALGEDLSLLELFERGDNLDFVAAPNPTALLRATAALDDERPDTQGTSLRLLSQNVALLDAKLLGFIDYARTPFLDERRTALPDRFLREGHDVLFFQEVWLPEDLALFTEAAAAAGYLAFPGNRDGHNDGLLLLVRESIVAAGTAPESDALAYQAQDGLEHFPGPGIKRGYQWVRFAHAEIGPVLLFNTHMQAFSGNWHRRLAQSRELGVTLREMALDGELVFVAGDMNAAPYYRTADWALPDGSVEEVWWKNALSYPVLLAYGELEDLAVMGRALADADSDVTLGDLVVNDATSAATTPGARAGYCDDTPPTTFTATDCNSLYFAQYAGTEFPARLDHIHARDPEGRVRVVDSRLMFTAAEAFGDVETEPSDHYGVSVDLMIDGR